MGAARSRGTSAPDPRHPRPPSNGCDGARIPPGVDWEDGLLANEAATIALWNNAAYPELLVEPGLTRADVIEAAQLTNPYFTTMLPDANAKGEKAYRNGGTSLLLILVLLSAPLALLGGVAGAWLGGGAISLGSLVGFVTVLGISTRNGIMLIRHYRHLQEREGMSFGTELVLRGAEERLAPILMTALTTALALLPLILAGNRPGHEIEYPVAWVIVGGLVSSTLMNLLFLPALYRAFGGGPSRRFG